MQIAHVMLLAEIEPLFVIAKSDLGTLSISTILLGAYIKSRTRTNLEIIVI